MRLLSKNRPIAEGDIFDDGRGCLYMCIDGRYYGLTLDFKDEGTPNKDWERLEDVDRPFDEGVA